MIIMLISILGKRNHLEIKMVIIQSLKELLALQRALNLLAMILLMLKVLLLGLIYPYQSLKALLAIFSHRFQDPLIPHRWHRFSHEVCRYVFLLVQSPSLNGGALLEALFVHHD